MEKDVLEFLVCVTNRQLSRQADMKDNSRRNELKTLAKEDIKVTTVHLQSTASISVRERLLVPAHGQACQLW